MSEFRTAATGALIVMLGPISMSLYTPALPAMVHAFDTTPAAIKLTLTVYFCGFALAQLVCGPLSDAYGRRPVGLGFFSIYLVGSLIAALTSTLDGLLLGRVLQGVGAAAGISISRAMVRDQYSGQRSARIMNMIGIMLAIGPAISPTLGGIILATIGWQAIFVLMVVYGAFVIGLILFITPETNSHIDRALARPRRVLASYRHLLGNRQFMGASLLMAMSPGGLYTLAAMLPFVMIERVGLTPTQFGMGMLAQTGSYMTGAAIVGVLLRRYDAFRLIPVGLALVALSGVGFAVGLHLWEPSFVSVMGPVALWAFGNAFIMPGTTAGALAPFPHIAGAASAMTGFMQIGGGLAGTAAAALLFKDPFQAMVIIMTCMAAIAVIAYFALSRGGPASLEAEAEEARVSESDKVDIELAADPAGTIGNAGGEQGAAALRKLRRG